MDELLSLVADSTEADLAAESASNTLPAADFTASLDYIDSLASRSSVSINRRDLTGIAAAVSTFDYLSPLISSKAAPGPLEKAFSDSSDMRPLQDARLYSPLRGYTRPAGLSRSASDVVSYPRDRIATPEKPYTPEEIEKAINSPYYREATATPWNRRGFRQPSRTVICLKRKIRRKIMHAFGFAGLRGFRRPRYNYWSRVIC